MSSVYAVGKEVVCYCTKCKLDLSHMIVSMVGDRVARVMCKTCKSNHNYKPSLSSRQASASSSSSLVRKRAASSSAKEEKTQVSVSEYWEKKLFDSKGKPALPYAATGEFKVGDVIEHPTFGTGVIEKTIYPNKVEVIFRGDHKVLIHKLDPG